MTRILTYRQGAQVDQTTADTVRGIALDWHDPANENYLQKWQERPAVDSNGDAISEGGNPQTNANIAAQVRGIAESDIQTELENFTAAINAAFPADWPTVETTDIDIDRE